MKIYVAKKDDSGVWWLVSQDSIEIKGTDTIYLGLIGFMGLKQYNESQYLFGNQKDACTAISLLKGVIK